MTAHSGSVLVSTIQIQAPFQLFVLSILIWAVIEILTHGKLVMPLRSPKDQDLFTPSIFTIYKYLPIFALGQLLHEDNTSRLSAPMRSSRSSRVTWTGVTCGMSWYLYSSSNFGNHSPVLSSHPWWSCGDFSLSAQVSLALFCTVAWF